MVKISIELKLKSCYPEGQTLEKQMEKLEEELRELKEAQGGIKTSEEALHVATVAVGIAELSNKEIKKGCTHVFGDVQTYLQEIIDRRYKEKQVDFKEGRQ